MTIHDTELPPSTVDPLPNPGLATDYRDVIKECDRLLVKIRKLKADWFARYPEPEVVTAPSPS